MKSLCTAFALIAVIASQDVTAQTPSLYAPVMLGGYYNASTNGMMTPAEWKPDGTSFQALSAAQQGSFLTDLSAARLAGSRWFVRIEPHDQTTYDKDLVVYDESGANRTVLNPGVNLDVWRIAWSHSGTRLAWAGRLLTSDGLSSLPGEEGIYVADVVTDASGRPSGIANISRLVTASSTSLQTNQERISWRSDDLTLAFMAGSTLEIAPVDPFGTPTAAVPVAISGLPSSPWKPVFSPAAGDFRIGFQSAGVRANVAVYELYSVNLPANYAGAALAATQITNKNNAKTAPNSAWEWDWSPDGVYVAYTGSATINGYPRVSKLKSNGSGTETVVNGSNNTGYVLWQWRP
jgi:hypothetical protein